MRVEAAARVWQRAGATSCYLPRHKLGQEGRHRVHGARVDQRLSAASRVVRGAPCGNRHVGAGHRGARLARRCCCWRLQLGLVAMIDVRPFIYKQTTHPGDADTQAHRQSPAQGRARRRPERRPKLTQRQSEAGSDSRSGVRLCVPVPVCPVSQGCANLGSDRHRGVGSRLCLFSTVLGKRFLWGGRRSF